MKKQRRSRAIFRPVGSASPLVVAIFEEAHRQRTTGVKLCSLTNMTKNRLYGIRRGVTFPDAFELESMAEALGMTIKLEKPTVTHCGGVIERASGNRVRCLAIARDGVVLRSCGENCEFMEKQNEI